MGGRRNRRIGGSGGGAAEGGGEQARAAGGGPGSHLGDYAHGGADAGAPHDESPRHPTAHEPNRRTLQAWNLRR